MKTQLTQAVTEYQASRRNLEQVIDAVALAVYWYPPMRKKWDEDDCSEFLCYFYRRIPGMIQRFRYSGSPFEALLKVTLQFQMKSFALQMKKQRIAEKVLASELFCDRTCDMPCSCTGETKEPDLPPVPGELRERLEMDERGFITDPCIRKRLLMLVLREAERLNESLLCHVLTLTGIERQWLMEKIEMVRMLSFQQEGRRNTCRHRRNSALFNICCLQEELTATPDLRERIPLEERLARERRNLSGAEKSLRRIPVSPTHRQLAEILDIPKGTVDSGLFFISRLLGDPDTGEQAG